MDIQEEITKAAEAYDPEYEVDAGASRALLQGSVAGMLIKSIRETPEGQLPRIGACAVSNITQGLDEHGNYQPYFTITTGAGHRIKVTFEVER